LQTGNFNGSLLQYIKTLDKTVLSNRSCLPFLSEDSLVHAKLLEVRSWSDVIDALKRIPEFIRCLLDALMNVFESFYAFIKVNAKINTILDLALTDTKQRFFWPLTKPV